MTIDLGRVVDEFVVPMLDSDAIESLRTAAATQTDVHLQATLLGFLAQAGDVPARKELVSRVLAGDKWALTEIGDVRALDVAAATAIFDTFESQVETTIGSAARGEFAVASIDAARVVALTNALFPGVARWPVLLEFLADDNVTAGQKKGACEVLVGNASLIPEEQRSAIRDVIPMIASSRSRLFDNDVTLTGLAAQLAFVLGGLNDEEVNALVASSLTAGEHRADTARLLGLANSEEFTWALVALAFDSHADVQVAATRALASRLAASTSDRAARVAIEQLLIRRDGAAVPAAVLFGLEGLTRDERPEDDVITFVRGLTAHPAAHVRRRAERLRRQGDNG
jgi:hypothetical protein